MARQKTSHRSRIGAPAPVAARKTVSSAPFASYQRFRSSSRAPKPKGRTLTVMTPQGPKPVGFLEDRDGRLVLVRDVDVQRHLLRRPEPAWAVDARGLREAQTLGADRVEVRDAKRGDVWYSPLDYILSAGRHFDRGWGEQVALPLTRWSFLPGKGNQNAQLPF